MPPVQLVSIGEGTWGVQGRLTFATTPEFVHRFSELKGDAVIDLQQVELADSAGLAMLVEWAMQAETQGINLSFSHIPIQVLAMARVSGLDEILPMS